MLEMLRRGASSKLSMFFIGILLISFVIWPASDGIRSYGAGTAITVGSQTFSPEDYRQALNSAMRQKSNERRRPYGLSEARSDGLTQDVVAQMISEGLLDDEASRLRLGQDAQVIANLPQQLDMSDLSARQYFDAQLRSNLRTQIEAGLSGAVDVPDVLREAAYQVSNSRRRLEFVTISESHLDPIAPPSESTLKTYFDANKERFRYPQFRAVELLAMTPESVGKTLEIDEADVREAYDTRIAAFQVPEKRHVRQIIFASKEDAQNAATTLASGTSFEALSQREDLKGTASDLGVIEKSAIADTAIADAVFSLEEATNSGVIAGKFGFVIARVERIEPLQTSSFDEVRADIESVLRLERARQSIVTQLGPVDDMFAEGRPFAEIAEAFNMEYIQLEAISRQGNDTKRQPVSQVWALDVDHRNLFRRIFETDIEIENDPMSFKNGGFLWYQVKGITPTRLPTFEEARDEVERQWRADETDKALRTKAETLLEALKGGETLDAIATTLSTPKKTVADLQRFVSNSDFPASNLAAFALPEGDSAQIATRTGTSRILFTVIDETVPAFNAEDEEAKNVAISLQATMQADINEQYLDALRGRTRVSVNQNAIDYVLGARENAY